MAPEVAHKSDPEGDGGTNRIPKERVDAMIAKATADANAKAEAAEKRALLESERRKDLEARTQHPAAPPAPTPPEKPPPTRAQLRALVDEGQITQDEMDAEIERQIEARVTQTVSSAQDTKDRAAKINEEIDLYMERIGDLKDPTSDNHQRIRAEYAALRKRGYENDATTELLALRSVFGDPEKVKIPETGNVDRETDATTHAGGGSEGRDEPEDAGDGSPKGLDKDFKDYYSKAIEKGRFKGWDDPNLKKITDRRLAKAKS
jgi:hypothetical protein